MQFQCPQCDRKLETWFDLVSHCTEHGSARLPSASLDNSLRPQRLTEKKGKLLHKCELCYKAFASEERLSVSMTIVNLSLEMTYFLVFFGLRVT